MQVSVETTKGLERKMTVTLPAERLDNEVDQRLRKLGKKAKIKGFRPGKVPFSVVKQHYGAEVRGEVVQDLIQSSYSEALIQQKLQPAGQPAIAPTRMGAGEGLSYTATFEVYPEIKLKKVEGLKVERPVASVTDEDVAKMLETMRKQRGSWEAVERAAGEGDRVTIDFEGKLKGEDFPGNKGENFPVEIGGGRMLEDFENGLKGLKAGDESSFDVKFPKDYHADDLKGKKVTFAVKVHQVEAMKLPALDDEFAGAFVQEGGLDKLKQDVREHMERELDQAIRRKLKEQVLDALVAGNKVDLPNALVDEEIHSMQHDMAQRMGQKADPHHLPRDLFEERARKRVALGLLLGEVIKSNDLKAGHDEITATLKKLTANYGEQDEVIRSYRSNPQVMRQVEAMTLEEQAVDLLLEKATIKDKSTGFDDLMNNAG